MDNPNLNHYSQKNIASSLDIFLPKFVSFSLLHMLSLQLLYSGNVFPHNPKMNIEISEFQTE